MEGFTGIGHIAIRARDLDQRSCSSYRQANGSGYGARRSPSAEARTHERWSRGDGLAAGALGPALLILRPPFRWHVRGFVDGGKVLTELDIGERVACAMPTRLGPTRPAGAPERRAICTIAVLPSLARSPC